LLNSLCFFVVCIAYACEECARGCMVTHSRATPLSHSPSNCQSLTHLPRLSSLMLFYLFRFVYIMFVISCTDGPGCGQARMWESPGHITHGLLSAQPNTFPIRYKHRPSSLHVKCLELCVISLNVYHVCFPRFQISWNI
jgi:hypothetical protein